MTDCLSPTPEILERARRIEAILMDVDGVLTPGTIVYDSSGNEVKYFHALDGQGIRLAHMAGIQTGVISLRDNPAVRRRVSELGMSCVYLGENKKPRAFRDATAQLGVDPSQICFIGDDLPDVPCMRQAGLAVAVANAADEVQAEAHYVTRRAGGQGAVREVIDLVLRARGLYREITESLWAEDEYV